MAMDSDLFRAILAMDSYNRGYGAGILGLSNATNTAIGTATIYDTKGDSEAQGANFYAIAYNWNGETVISYRGTNTFADALTYPLALGNYNVEQARLAAQFYLGLAAARYVASRA
jgi:hypothetical protein